MLGNWWYLSFYFPSHSSSPAADTEEVQTAFKWSCFFLLVICATAPEWRAWRVWCSFLYWQWWVKIRKKYKHTLSARVWQHRRKTHGFFLVVQELICLLIVMENENKKVICQQTDMGFDFFTLTLSTSFDWSYPWKQQYCLQRRLLLYLAEVEELFWGSLSYCCF